MSVDAHVPGGSRTFPLQPGVTGGADFSACGRYRTNLWRMWGDDLTFALWIGMNPSTARADVDDPTVRREIEFTRRAGLAGLVKCNVMDYRATNPADLLRPGVFPRSPENLRWITRQARHADLIVAAWGALPRPLRPYAEEVAWELLRAGRKLVCLGYTADGSPRHPLYVKGDAAFVPYPRGGA